MSLQGNVLFAIVTAAFAATSALAADTHCFDEVAATRGYSLGTPVGAVPAPDGKNTTLRRAKSMNSQRLTHYSAANRRI